MSACSEEMILYMHDYLNGELSKDREEELKKHIQSCQSCQKHFQELKKTDAFIKSAGIISAPEGFTAAVMARLPQEKKKMKFQRWLRNHPIMSAAVLFIVLMAGSVFSNWHDQQEFSFTKNPHLLVKNHTVIVPKGDVIKGDLVVKNGNVRVEGKVEGDVTVINGKQYMASARNVSGNIEVINQVYDWIWFKIKGFGKSLVHLFQ
ncbi:anti-sigma factor family protein [Heyndrickxia acidicola]|uniref:Anti-sigma-W factor RsiW n=1 Tax=Heyndrickxia acidicola TaxID=209389 RepID=A0ABU6MGS8_9BACI|nr:anti-sigma factor [Heyndrickxia acidicola]MED1203884.1 anti-sigma factor [Heyndrickxia acidicola]